MREIPFFVITMRRRYHTSFFIEPREIEHFRKERINYFLSIEDDEKNTYSRFALLHIIPETFLDHSHNKNMYVLNRKNNNKFSQIFSPFYCSNYVKPNVDGVHTVAYEGSQEGQLFDSGIAECFVPISDYYLSKVTIGQVTLDYFAHVAFWEQLHYTVNNYIDALSTVIDAKRVFVCFSIIGCRGIITNNNHFTVQECAKIDRTMMIGNPVVFENIKDDSCVFAAMKRLEIDYHLSLGLRLTSDEMSDIESGRI